MDLSAQGRFQLNGKATLSRKDGEPTVCVFTRQSLTFGLSRICSFGCCSRSQFTILVEDIGGVRNLICNFYQISTMHGPGFPGPMHVRSLLKGNVSRQLRHLAIASTSSTSSCATICHL